ncbi:MAG: mevalonate kinase [Bradymonadia bacterium]
MLKPYVARAPGKVMLFGEYAVLDNCIAIVAAVERRAKCAVTLGPERTEIAAPGLTEQLAHVGRHSPSGDPLAFVQGLLDRWPAPSAGRFTTDSSALYSQAEGIKLGLGSSAAVSVALAGALAAAGGAGQLVSGQRSEERNIRRIIFERVHGAHRAVQGSGSGADVAASVMGGVIIYRLRTIHEASTDLNAWAAWRTVVDEMYCWAGHTQWLEETPLMMVWTGQSASTKVLVPQIKRWAQQNPEGWRLRRAGIEAAARAGQGALFNADRSALVEAVRMGAEAITALGQDAEVPLIIPAHESISYIAEAHGAAAKPTGAAGGDMSWVLPRYAADLAPLKSAYEAAGWHVEVLPICPAGLSVSL